MISSPSFLSTETARQILSAAAQNGLTVEAYLEKIANSENGDSDCSASFKPRSATLTADFAKSHEWLRSNRQNHLGKWVVLNEGELVGSGENPLPIAAKARAAGVKIPFIQFISGDSEPFTGGWL